ncbi:biopolymer transporter ExbD [Halothiobacillus diazotrophicus]|uniref:Biopolymer transporter ExbD n=1 Tax=Halothiobacillus diazotrophicus TaxID=1860122 RepID=A0A191ZE27_9GAMM|nr:biopolymer transporter ExbD [Halothiobacillus diazotrophicus]ANJ66120.1 biopolymer transporter ExbD [Halothiobacillus diazotrophicus]
MAKRYHYLDAERPRIEIIPMIDIMMFLLVFFIMVTLKMIPGTGVQLNLPGASTADKLPTTQVVIGVAEDGSMHIADQTMDKDQLAAYLNKMHQDKTQELQVIIAGDKQVSLQNLLAVMDVARAQGISGVGIATSEVKQ